MRIHLTNAGPITLCDATDFRRLDVLVDPQPHEQLEQAIARLGRREDDTHLRLSPAVLRFLSSQAGDPVWEAGFGKMVEYAAKAGWVDAQGCIRAHITPNTSDTVVSVQDFKAAMRALPAGVSVIATGRDNDVAGMVVSSLTSISAEPPLVGFFIHQNASMHDVLLANGQFVANILGEDHEAIMSAVLREPQGPPRFAGGAWMRNDDGVPVLADAAASVECDIVSTHSLGTHDLVVGKIRRARTSDTSPLVHHNAATHRLVNCVAQ